MEHPVSEEVSGLDLVREMFRIADGEELGYGDPPEITGHSIEFRINAEDAGRNFMPAPPGTLTEWHPPLGPPGVRVDEGYEKGMTVPGSFDSLVAKIIVTGASREQAIQRARRALKETRIDGMPTVIPFHRQILLEPAYLATGDAGFAVHTRWIETEFDNRIEPFEAPAATEEEAEAAAKSTVVVEVNGKRVEVKLPATLGSVAAPAAAKAKKPKRAKSDTAVKQVSSNALTCPMQGTIVKVAVNEGDTVSEGDLIVVLEAMKMEQPISAHRSGVITGLNAAQGGDRVQRHRALRDHRRARAGLIHRPPRTPRTDRVRGGVPCFALSPVGPSSRTRQNRGYGSPHLVRRHRSGGRCRPHFHAPPPETTRDAEEAGVGGPVGHRQGSGRGGRHQVRRGVDAPGRGRGRPPAGRGDEPGLLPGPGRL